MVSELENISATTHAVAVPETVLYTMAPGTITTEDRPRSVPVPSYKIHYSFITPVMCEYKNSKHRWPCLFNKFSTRILTSSRHHASNYEMQGSSSCESFLVYERRLVNLYKHPPTSRRLKGLCKLVLKQFHFAI